MSASLHESIAVDGSDEELIRAVHVSRRAAGVDMGGELVFHRKALEKIVEALEAAIAAPMHPDQDFVVGDDDISVFSSGHDSSPFVNVTVRRFDATPARALYNVIMTPQCARELVALLRAL